MPYAYCDFFAGGGMAGIGLGPGWRCAFANEIDPRKAASYRANHEGGPELLVKDVAQVRPDDIPGRADLVWASFPCQDLSLAGKGAGLAGRRSGMFAPFWALVEGLCGEGRAPRLVALENVQGAITSNGGRDFATLAAAFAGLGYRFGALVVDAALFLPHSRPRLFVIGVHPDLDVPETCVSGGPAALWHPKSVAAAQARLPEPARDLWQWWNPPPPEAPVAPLSALITDVAEGIVWHSEAQTRRLLDLMSEVNLAKVAAARAAGARAVGAVYRRTRSSGPDGAKQQRAEVRFDGVAGCLRTPAGGSSRQTLLIVEDGRVRSRLLAPREAAALMGLPDDFVLPESRHDAWKLAGDGVAAPVVRFLADTIFEPVLGKAGLALAA